VPVILKLEDFGLDLDFDAVQVHWPGLKSTQV
jgi:hypothetical protein